MYMSVCVYIYIYIYISLSLSLSLYLSLSLSLLGRNKEHFGISLGGTTQPAAFVVFLGVSFPSTSISTSLVGVEQAWMWMGLFSGRYFSCSGASSNHLGVEYAGDRRSLLCEDSLGDSTKHPGVSGFRKR